MFPTYCYAYSWYYLLADNAAEMTQYHILGVLLKPKSTHRFCWRARFLTLFADFLGINTVPPAIIKPLKILIATPLCYGTSRSAFNV